MLFCTLHLACKLQQFPFDWHLYHHNSHPQYQKANDTKPHWTDAQKLDQKLSLRIAIREKRCGGRKMLGSSSTVWDHSVWHSGWVITFGLTKRLESKKHST